MAVFSWLNGSLMALSRVQENNAISEAKINALEYMNTINPMLDGAGDADLGDYALHWQAELVTEVRDNVGYPKGKGLYAVALYQTQVSVTRGGQSIWFGFSLQQVGFKKVREMQLPF